jgi:hypothetical protein
MSDFNRLRPRPDQLPAAAQRPQRRPTDVGAIALAMSGMTMYWMTPLLMERRRRRAASPPASKPAPATTDTP